MEYLSKKLFGNTTEKQKRYIENIFIGTIIYALLLMALFIESKEWGMCALAVYLLVLGWPALRATMKITRLAELFEYNLSVIIVILIISQQGIRIGTMFRSISFLLRTTGSPLRSTCI